MIYNFISARASPCRNKVAHSKQRVEVPLFLDWCAVEAIVFVLCSMNSHPRFAAKYVLGSLTKWPHISVINLLRKAQGHSKPVTFPPEPELEP
jgi:hypothetical protein